MHSESGFRIAPNWPWIRKMTGISQFPDTMSLSNFVDLVLCLFKFSYWSKCYVNNITGYGVMTIFFYKGSTRNPEIGNNPMWVLPNIWRLGWVRDIKFYKNVSNKMLLNAAKCHGYKFYCFWVITGKPIGGIKLPPPPSLGLLK